MRKIFYYIHLLLSIPSGILITLICLTGSMLVFEQEIIALGYDLFDQSFFKLIKHLHRWLLFPDRSTGRLIIGISTIFFAFILLSGLACWWPRNLKQFKQSYLIKSNGSFTRKLLDLHRVVGIYLLPMLLVLALTGLMWSFPWYKAYMRELFDVRHIMFYVRQIHSGTWGGAFVKFIYFCVSLFGASLPITGYILYFRKNRRKRGKKQLS